MNTAEQQVAEDAERTVLIVDDEPQILSAIQDLLEDDFAVLAVTNAEAALRLLEEKEVSVILSDQRMPGLSGDQFLREAQKRSRATRVLISGYADFQAMIRAVNEGKIYGFVAKPWEPEALRSLVSKAADYFALVQNLEHERNLLHTLMDHIPDHVYFKDTAARFTRINKAMARAVGLSDPREAIGKTDADLFPAEAARQFLEDERQIIELAQPLVDQVEEVREADGQQRWYSTTKVPLRDEQGATIGLVGISRDITERMQVEQKVAVQLAVQRVRNEILQMQGEEGWEKVVLAFKEELGNLVKFNEAGVNTLAHQDQSIVVRQGRRQEVLTAEENFSPPFLQAMKAEVPMYRRNREEMARWGDIALLAMGIGAVVEVPFSTGTVAMNSTEEAAFSERDIQILGQFAPVMSEAQRRLEDLKILALTERQLHQSQKMEAIGQLVGGVAHDFNNLLTIITGYSQLLLRQRSAADPQEAYVDEIMKAAERGTTLVGQLLAFSRKQVLQSEVLDLNVVVSDLKKMLRPLIGEDVELYTHLTPDLGSVKADRGQVEQVLMNLAVNARDALPRGGKLVIETHNAELDETYTLRHTVVKPGPYVLLSVSDTGVGMDMATQERIFEPFFTTKELGKGTGLGLATVYGIVKQSGGYIWVYSEPAKGTTFKIYLPRLEKTLPMATREELPPVTVRGVETILLVEDEGPLRQLVALLLRAEGYTVLEASHGEEAPKISAQHQGTIHLLVSDVVMPGMGRHEVLKELKSSRPEMKVLYISGYSAQAVQNQGVLQPGIVFLQKPFKRERLLGKVREAMETTPPMEE